MGLFRNSSARCSGKRTLPFMLTNPDSKSRREKRTLRKLTISSPTQMFFRLLPSHMQPKRQRQPIHERSVSYWPNSDLDQYPHTRSMSNDSESDESTLLTNIASRSRRDRTGLRGFITSRPIQMIARLLTSNVPPEDRLILERSDSDSVRSSLDSDPFSHTGSWSNDLGKNGAVLSRSTRPLSMVSRGCEGNETNSDLVDDWARYCM